MVLLLGVGNFRKREVRPKELLLHVVPTLPLRDEGKLGTFCGGSWCGVNSRPEMQNQAQALPAPHQIKGKQHLLVR